MKIITLILLHAFVGFFYFQRVSTTLPPNHIFVAMKDLTDFMGPLHMSENLEGFYTIPTWMQPGEAEVSTGVFAFIRLSTGEHYEGALETTNGPANHDPYPHGPAICEIRLGENLLLRTEPFELYNPTHVHYPELPCYPPSNRVYITMRGGPIYYAVLLAPHELASTHNRLRMETASLDDNLSTPSAQSSRQAAHQPPHQTGQPSSKAAKTHHSSRPR